MPIALYMDQHVPRAITLGLRLRAVDVLTAHEDGASTFTDLALLERATTLGRVLFTQDDDLLAEATHRQMSGVPFGGVIYGHQLRVTIGQCVHDLELITQVTEPDELRNHLSGGHAMSEPSTSPATRPASVLGDGWGLDHVVHVVRDLAAAEELYRSRLGFTVSPGGSFPNYGDVRNSIIGFGKTYIEVLTAKPEGAIGLGQMVAAFLQEHEGAVMVGVAVSSAQQAADFLSERGFTIAGPIGGTITMDDDTEEPPERWRYVMFTQPVVPADAIFFLEYGSTPGSAIEAPPAQHANTARRLASVWMAVRDLAAATAAYESIGLPAVRELRHERLGATGRVIGAGTGEIWLLEAAEEGGAVASFLARRGDGVIGMGIEVTSLDDASASLAADIQQRIAPYDGPAGRAVLLDPDLTHGVWIELFQR
jgi:catechol 2,3-dioxygenase-like lactoylglutathione lyase family enzyme